MKFSHSEISIQKDRMIASILKPLPIYLAIRRVVDPWDAKLLQVGPHSTCRMGGWGSVGRVGEWVDGWVGWVGYPSLLPTLGDQLGGSADPPWGISSGGQLTHLGGSARGVS